MARGGHGRQARRGAAVVLLALGAGLAPLGAAGAQEISDTLVLRALELEGWGRVREAAPLFRQAIAGSDVVTALLGLERAYAELGMTDSLLEPIRLALGRAPADPVIRTVQLRTLHTLRRETELRAAAGEWARAVPGDPSPYRELARLLIAEGRTRAADSIIAIGRRAVGGPNPFAHELAQLEAASGEWERSAENWRAALATQPWLALSAAHALAPVPAERREGVRAAFLRPPLEAASRLALANLESRWGSAARGWEAVRDLPADSAAAEAWLAFAEGAEADGRWAQARAALEAVLRWREAADVRLRAATAALLAGDPAGAMALAPVPSAKVDSADVAQAILPLHVRALAQLGRAAEAERLVASYDRFIHPGPRAAMAREIAMGWVRGGDLARARAALAVAGEDADSSAAAGWIALYEGDAAAARALLGRGDERTAEVALALNVLARFRDARAPAIGSAFLTLARGDTTQAAAQFGAAAERTPAAASLLLLTAARLHLASRDTAKAMAQLAAIAETHRDAPEAPEALLHLARALAARGERAQARGRLEHLILTYPTSALVPVARRELELAQQPPSPRP